MLRWRGTRKTSGILCHMCERFIGDLERRKRKPEKSPPASTPRVRRKLLWLCLVLAIGVFSFPTGAKAFYSAQQKKGIGIFGGFSTTRKWRFMFALHRRRFCRLHLVVLVDLIMFTHIKSHIPRSKNPLSHVFLYFLPSRRTPVTDPMFDVSFSCIMLCHLRRYRYVNARKRGARHHPAVPHGWAAHARVADASRRDASHG